MAGHGESLEKRGGKHGSWMEGKKKMLTGTGLATMGANYLLGAMACVAFPPYILAAATGASVYGLWDPAKPKKGKASRAHH
jgi:hypothetical protein